MKANPNGRGRRLSVEILYSRSTRCPPTRRTVLERTVDRGRFPPQRYFAGLPAAAPRRVVPWLRSARGGILEPPRPLRGYRDPEPAQADHCRQRPNLAGRQAVPTHYYRASLAEDGRDRSTEKRRTQRLGFQGSAGMPVHDGLEVPAPERQGSAGLSSLLGYDVLAGQAPIYRAPPKSDRSSAYIPALLGRAGSRSANVVDTQRRAAHVCSHLPGGHPGGIPGHGSKRVSHYQGYQSALGTGFRRGAGVGGIRSYRYL